MTKMKKILLLGGSAQQVPTIKVAKEMGYYTVLIDYLPDNPGQFIADKWYCVSTTDVEAVYEVAKRENVSGVLAYASDPAALPAAIVCDRLGLPANPVRSVEILGVKHRFRDFLSDNGFPSPTHLTFNVDSRPSDIIDKMDSFRFPIVIKPTDSSGSKGVSFIKEYDEQAIIKGVDYARKFSRNGIIIVEEFIERGYPYVIGGDIYVVDGKIAFFGEMDCMRDDGGKSLIPIGKKCPSGLTELQIIRLHKELQRLVDLLHIKMGEFNIEAIIDKDSQPHFLEVGPRAGGNMIPLQLSDAYGIDLLKANVQSAIGEAPVLQAKPLGGCYMTHVLHSHEDGKFERIEYKDEIKPFIYRECVYKSYGDEVERFDGAGKALGILFLKFPDKVTMDRVERCLDDLITIRLA